MTLRQHVRAQTLYAIYTLTKIAAVLIIWALDR